MKIFVKPKENVSRETFSLWQKTAHISTMRLAVARNKP